MPFNYLFIGRWWTAVRAIAVTADEIRIGETALRRWQSERDAANASVRRLQASRIMTKKDWLEFSEKIRIAAERVLAESLRGDSR